MTHAHTHTHSERVRERDVLNFNGKLQYTIIIDSEYYMTMLSSIMLEFGLYTNIMLEF